LRGARWRGSSACRWCTRLHGPAGPSTTRETQLDPDAMDPRRGHRELFGRSCLGQIRHAADHILDGGVAGRWRVRLTG
jgi:hypothetical protein